MKSQPQNIVSHEKRTARAGQRRCALLTFLRSDRPAWQDHDHPELAAGAAAWVHNLRRESESRIKP